MTYQLLKTPIVIMVLVFIGALTLFSCKTDMEVVNNIAPIISGTVPLIAKKGVNYYFTPEASDADGDELIFSIINKPGWASFDIQTGTLTGIPQQDDIGISTGIIIEVSDGKKTASLKSFSISVIATSGAEVIVRANTNFSSPSDISNFVTLAKENNISVISVAVKQDEDTGLKSGEVFYNSQIAPIATGYQSFDVLADIIPKAHAVGIQIKAWIPQFHDQAAVNKNANWQMMAYENGQVVPIGGNGNEYFVNPLHPDVQDYELSIIAEIVENYDIDAVVLDWIRFDNYNMDVSDYTRNTYKNIFGYDPITINFASDNAKRSEWNDWRSTGISLYVKKVSDAINDIKPEMVLGLYVLTPEFEEVAQDPKKYMQYIDFVSPMAYYDDWGFSVDWIYREGGILSSTNSHLGNKEMIPVFDPDWGVSIYQNIFDNIKIKYPKITNLSFFEYGTWTESRLKNVNEIMNIADFPQ